MGLTETPPLIAVRQGSLPDDLILEVVFPKYLIEHHLDVVAGVPVAVVVEAAGLLEHAGQLDATRAHVVDVGGRGGVAVLERPLFLGLAPEDLVVAVAVERRGRCRSGPHSRRAARAVGPGSRRSRRCACRAGLRADAWTFWRPGSAEGLVWRRSSWWRNARQSWCKSIPVMARASIGAGSTPAGGGSGEWHAPDSKSLGHPGASAATGGGRYTRHCSFVGNPIVLPPAEPAFFLGLLGGRQSDRHGGHAGEPGF